MLAQLLAKPRTEISPRGLSSVGNGAILVQGVPIEEITTNLSYTDIPFFELQGRVPKENEARTLDEHLISFSQNARKNPPTAGTILTSDMGATFPMSVMNFITRAQYQYETLEIAMKDLENDAIQSIDHVLARSLREMGFRSETSLLFPIIGSLPHLARIYSSNEANQDLEPTCFVDTIFTELLSRMPTDKERYMMDKYLVSLCEHADTSPSTHGPRVASNVGAHFSASAISFIAAATGQYHFGALEMAMGEIEYITNSVKDIEAYVDNRLAASQSIWGFGHRFHRTDNSPDLPPGDYEAMAELKDPRVKILFELADQIGWEGNYLTTVREVGRLMYEKKGIYINVDGGATGLLKDMGFEKETALMFPIIGRLLYIAKLHHEEMAASTNRYVALVDRNDPHYGERAVTVDYQSEDSQRMAAFVPRHSTKIRPRIPALETTRLINEHIELSHAYEVGDDFNG